MKKINSRETKPERYDLIDIEADGGVVSHTEQTGLIAAAPKTEHAYESYDEVYDFKPK